MSFKTKKTTAMTAIDST